MPWWFWPLLVVGEFVVLGLGLVLFSFLMLWIKGM